MLFLLVFSLFSCQSGNKPNEIEQEGVSSENGIFALNEKDLPYEEKSKAIVGVLLIDGKGGDPIENAAVLISGNRIIAIGPGNEIDIPDGTAVLDAKGMTMVPGLIDAHFHLDRSEQLPNLFLKRGITSLRDPGAWIEAYNGERQAGYALPRLFLTGPHFDMSPPAYPHDAFIVRDEAEARIQVNKLADK